MSPQTPSIPDFRRVVIKVGSPLLVDSEASRVREDWLRALAEDIAELHADKRDVLVVSSGAIALGRSVLKLPRGPLKLEDSQAAAAVGQIALARTWAEVLSRYDITAGQILVTLQDTEERRRPLKAIRNQGRCTWFLTSANPVASRKKWIAGSLEPRGVLTIDAGAVVALRNGRSLLPAGVLRVDGTFSRGDAVVIRGPDGAEIG